jgi:glycine hydroxymethyltransferase
MTTRGLKEDDMMQVADFIDSALKKRHDAGALAALRREVVSFTARFPLP